MSTMTDPYEGLISYQQALNDKLISPSPCSLYKDMTIYHDVAEGNQRLTFAIMDNGIVKATAVYVFAPNIDGIPCFGIGYSVAENYRKKGIATEIVTNSIKEFSHGMKGKLPLFYIEAIIDLNNIASQKVALKTISNTPKETIDKISGKPAYQFIKLVKNS
ncbi:GNAT family N-acetyltransferase [Proteus mirabilis]|uniref:GNAT family N-acetyltransferase n=1 Tax=Proteus mirabilis TaxID=584 RepID=UPI00073C93E2|nr:GNAT family N-acetyltransferase [Proteus mirabilis]EMA1122472.1 GNAT family N-acetyltransferase [Proteus mirabilis]KSW14447.1 hypothetical protein OJ22_17595 [Proteus mirabilis]MCT0128886.1 GNAT family N-acetyltransferase [Proteus mirabilis]MCZ5107778.1 GNAT family N-acetyltransferase [Proteus mirabilis]MDF7352804.1 GNAT family N-acetyltransferase [Proteus mirabilis]